MRILITGSRGFIGKNLIRHLQEKSEFIVNHFTRKDSMAVLRKLVNESDAIIHLAGENRPNVVNDFKKGNSDLTKEVCDAIVSSGRKIPIFFSSSIQAELDNPYGISKVEAENYIEKMISVNGGSAIIYRLPGVFGKWCRPNYNSVVATFCHNIANDMPIKINDPSHSIQLVYIDDLIKNIIYQLNNIKPGLLRLEVKPTYFIALGELANQVISFKECRSSLTLNGVGVGLTRALYATYLSYLPFDKFTYHLPCYGDERGYFVEMLKNADSGQVSFFTAHPGVTRGGHYHHTKTEKFLVIRGSAHFGFRNILTNEVHEFFVEGNKPQVVETIPGWAHDITNIGNDELIVLLWANEIFDRRNPDTFTSKVSHE